MRFYNIDMHISVIADIKDVFGRLGHDVYDDSISGHAWVMNRTINPIYNHLRDRLQTLAKSNYGKEFCDKNSTLKDYDGFIVTYPPAFTLLYKDYNKPIILYIPIRYEYPWSNDTTQWRTFNDVLRGLYGRGLLYPVANSLYDKEYFEGFTGIPCKYIPSLCEYTGINYAPKSSKVLYWSRKHIKRVPKQIESVTDYKNSRGGQYKWNALGEIMGIVHFPYNSSIMSFFEHYSANIPLFVPSNNLMRELYNSGDVMSEYSWNRFFNYRTKSQIKFNGPHDPNDYKNQRSFDHWLRLCDFNNIEWFPVVSTFGSLNELNDITPEMCSMMSKTMADRQEKRRKKILDLWKDVLSSL